MRPASESAARGPVLGVGHTGITVSDLRKSCWFYRDILQFPVSEPLRLSGRTVAEITGIPDAELDVALVRCPGHVLELLCFVRPEHQQRSKLRPCDPGAFHVCFKVGDVDRVLSSVRAAGFEAIGEVATLADGPAQGMRVVYARDPDGIVLELIEEPAGVCFEDLFFPSSPADPLL